MKEIVAATFEPYRGRKHGAEVLDRFIVDLWRDIWDQLEPVEPA